MSRNGLARSLPSFITRMRPACSTMNRRCEPSPALVTNTGLCNPNAMRVSLNEPFATVAAVGEGSGGEALGDGAALGLALDAAEGFGVGAPAVCCAQPAAITRTRARAMGRTTGSYPTTP